MAAGTDPEILRVPRHCTRVRRHARAFTLIELLVTIAVAAILVVVAVPSFQAVTCNSRGTAQLNSLISALSYARSEAVRRGAAVQICPRDTGGGCADSNDWSRGWLVVPGNDTSEVLREWQPLSGSASLTGPAVMRYQAVGTVWDESGSFNNEREFEYTLTAAGLQLEGSIHVEATGRARLTNERCSPPA